jgi:hypothetical protein
VRVGPRAFAWGLVVTGLGLSMNADEPKARALPQPGGYTILAADFHVHSFPGDGLLPPWDISREAQRRRLDVVGLTNHNSMFSSRFARWLAPVTGRPGAMLVQGEELTAVGYHLAAIGVDGPVDWRQRVASAAAAIHARGGVAIAAHPAGHDLRAYDDAALDALDGVEAAHPAMHVWDDVRRDLAAFYARAKRRHPGIAAIGSTDYHHFAPVGLCRTYVFATVPTQAGILDAIRRGKTVACDGSGRTYGPDDLVALVRDDCRRDATAPPAGDTWLDHVSTWAVWLGMCALVVAGADEVGPDEG